MRGKRQLPGQRAKNGVKRKPRTSEQKEKRRARGRRYRERLTQEQKSRIAENQRQYRAQLAQRRKLLTSEELEALRERQREANRRSYAKRKAVNLEPRRRELTQERREQMRAARRRYREKQKDNKKRKEMEQVTSDELAKGMTVICFEGPGMIRVGRVHSEITRYPLTQALSSGVFAEFDLLYADQHAQAEALAWQKYFYMNPKAPTGPAVFQWPSGLMKLTFDLAGSSLPDRPGWLVHIEVRPRLGPTIVI